jgi:hypothetical protein
MTTRREKIRKLRALGRSPYRHEAEAALAKAQALESSMMTARGTAQDIAQLLQGRGMAVRVKPHRAGERWSGSKVDVDVRYCVSRARKWQPPHQIMIEITEYDGK